MKLRSILEAMYSTTQYWILPSGKVKKMRSGHEEYLADEGLSYETAFKGGYIRLAVDDSDGTPSAEWSKEATPAAKKALGKIVKKTNTLYYDKVAMTSGHGWNRKKYIKSGDTDYKGYLKIK
tara:strand:+ start:102 stop:467 length:366 start_codon:yes stop_codon:yes gene_type:complete